MVAMANLRKVEAIIPYQMQQDICSGKYQTEELLLNIVSEKDAEVKTTNSILFNKPKTEKPTFKLVSQIREFKEERKIKKENKIFSKIKDQMVCNAFNIASIEDLETYKRDYKEIGINQTEKTLGDDLQNSRDIYNGQVGSNKRAKRELLIKTFTTGASVGWLGAKMLAGTVPVISEVLSMVAKLSVVGTGVMLGLQITKAIGGLILARKRGKKASIGNSAEARDKCDAYYKHLEKFATDSKEFLNSIEQDKELILSKQNSLNEKEFAEWQKNYSKEKYDELMNNRKVESGELAN